MKRALFFTTVFGAIAFVSVSATIINIPDDYPTIQDGINAASNGDTVLVHSGIYIEHIDFLGKGILVTGQEGPDLTIIESQTGEIPIVSFISGETSAAVLSGFTVRLSSYAAAVMIRYSSPLIIGNKFTDNDNDWLGGAISSDNGSFPTIKDNIFIGNFAFRGGAVDSGEYGESDIRIEENIFISNTSSTHGGAIFVRFSSLSTISRNVFYQNYCLAMGAAMCISRSSYIDVFNNTIAFNSNGEPWNGAGIVIWYSDYCQILNNIVVNNEGIGVRQSPYTTSASTYNDVWNNTVDYEGIAPDVGSISLDPLFIGGDPFDYHLQAESPCIDAGDPNSPLDPDGTVADVGAYYYLAGTTVYGLSIVDTYGENGQPVDVPIMAYGLENQEIAGVELHISYDNICLEYVDVSSDYLTDVLANVVDGEIHILWEDYVNPVMVPDSAAILNLQFTVLGQLGDTCPVAWLANNELVDPLGEVVEDLTFVDGSVNVVEFHDISGNVVYYDLLTPVADVTVDLSGDYSTSDVTNENGAYSFEDLFPGEFTICATRSDDDTGVTVGDIVLIRRHIVWLELFDTPYKLMAADVNGSGNVSVADIIRMRRYLAELGELPSGNWTFVDSSFAVTDENWPDVPACIDFTLWDADLTDSSFVGIRMGDVDYSWAQGRLGIPPPKVTDTAMLDLVDCYGQPGDTVRMSINVAGIADVAGLELHIEFPLEGISFIGFDSDVLTDPTTNGIDGEIHFIWEDIFDLVSLEDGEEVVSIGFEILEDAPDSILVSFSTAYVVDEEGIDFTVDSRDGYILRHQTPNYGDETVLPESYRLSQNYPNPFNAKTVIEFDLPHGSHVTIGIYDLLGRLVATIVNDPKAAGYHRIAYDAGEQPSGIYFYKIQTDNFADSKKMLLLK